MKKVIKEWEKGNYNFVYKQLKEKNFQYTLDNLERNFASINSQNKYCYLIYLLSMEDTPHNTLLLCDFLIYIDSFFYDIHPVIYMFLQKSLICHPFDITILKLILTTYGNHPNSPFSHDEIQSYRNKIDNN